MVRIPLREDPVTVVTPDKGLLKDRAYADIKQHIQSGEFAAGDFLSERQLAALLGMSKTPVKAALERLEQEGFVAVSPQQGIVVRELSIAEAADQFELRKALETYVVQAIAGKLSDRDLQAIERNLRQQSAAASRELVGRLVELDTEFHLLLCEAFGNRAIIDCLVQHREKMHRLIFRVMSKSPGRLSDAVREHVEIFVAVRSGEPSEAARLLDQHLDFGKQYLLSSQSPR
ncbi:GntR family transcriptional regulator [Planctellipticum variicoloris]|uniref:GntR family transcriptional regulator n=1 Tax=Planctellipticum variicoloris TaxID=3064265 RepID=UPI003013EEDA|nr:GntR family transcriptional regulator [Planctomycetaceae bacterium SH412]